MRHPNKDITRAQKAYIEAMGGTPTEKRGSADRAIKKLISEGKKPRKVKRASKKRPKK